MAVMAKLHDNWPFLQTTAFGGVVYRKGEWTPVPEKYEHEVNAHKKALARFEGDRKEIPYLEFKGTAKPEPKE